jgi:hypothetical protein
MIIRKIQIIFRLSYAENKRLKELVAKSKLTQSAYIRKLISGAVPKTAPPPEYKEMIQKLREIASNLQQILNFAKKNGIMETDTIADAAEITRNTVAEITKAVIEPEK